MKKNKSTFTINFITYSLMLSLAGVPVYAVDFNTDVLDAADRQNIDFSRFSRAGYIMPGQYQMEIRVNGQDISPSAFQIAFLEPPFSDSDNEKPLPEPCLTPEIVSRMGLTEASQEKVTYWNNGQCADFRKRLVRTVLIFTESSDQLSRATDRVPGLPASPGYVQ